MVRSLAQRALQIIAKSDAAPSAPNHGSHSLIARLSSGSGASTSGGPPASRGSAPGAHWRPKHCRLPSICLIAVVHGLSPGDLLATEYLIPKPAESTCVGNNWVLIFAGETTGSCLHVVDRILTHLYDQRY